MSQTHLSSEQLSLKTAALAIVGIVVIISIAIAIALYFNHQRSTQIIARYDQETNTFVQSKPQEIKKLFTETFPICQKLLSDKQASESAIYKSQDIICEPARQALGELAVDTLQDSSAVAYIRYENGNYELLEASGKYNQQSSVLSPISYSHFNYEQETRTELNDYMANAKEIDRWQDFITYIQGKEVIVPVVVDNQTVGFIFRGVIEK